VGPADVLAQAFLFGAVLSMLDWANAIPTVAAKTAGRTMTFKIIRRSMTVPPYG